MERIIKSRIWLTGVFMLILMTFNSCDDSYLQEIPKGFLSPENTFTSKEGFDSGINDLYRISSVYATTNRLPGMVDGELDKSMTALYCSGTDMGWYWNKIDYNSNYALVNSFNSTARDYWILSYTLIKGANVIISRAESDRLNGKMKRKNLKLLLMPVFSGALLTVTWYICMAMFR
jgi:starch-binding outer membrane protein, SusD/RagB family